jgi:hypothetical protein
MKFLGFTYNLAVFLGVSSAQQIQVNDYSDSSCSNFDGQVGTSAGNCYTYNFGQSLLVASCSSGCDCGFFTDENCQNIFAETAGTGQCITDGSEINSFFCSDS